MSAPPLLGPHLLLCVLQVIPNCRPTVAQTVKNPLAVQETWVRSLGWEDPLEKGMATHSRVALPLPGKSLLAQMVKRLPTMWETQVRSLGWEDPLEKEMATHSSILAWRIPWTEEPGYSPRGCKESDTTE